jgi:energy-coupling factor transporter ATP-binding protein EcfA2
VRLKSEEMLGRVTFVTGPEKGCGKSTLVNHALGLLREAGEKPALLAVGLGGESLKLGSGDTVRRERGRKPGSLQGIECLRGEVFVSAERYLLRASCLPEILDVLPGSTALGHLAIARAHRRGRVVLVGAECNEYAAWAIERIREEHWARTVLVDGAINRITQVSSFSGARFLFVMRVSAGDLDRACGSIRRMYRLATLPVVAASAADDASKGGLTEPLWAVEGPLTGETLSRVSESVRTILVDDFTKVFLDAQELGSLLRSRVLAVRTGIEFGGFVVVLRDLSRERFIEALGDPTIERFVAFNPNEVVNA